MSGIHLLETGGGLQVLTSFSDHDEAPVELFIKPGTAIGPYRIIERVGYGGMGSVYRASRRHDGVAQDVAIKILKSGGVSRFDLLERFRHEQRVLASLDALGVSRMIDSGVSDDDHPYIVMEFISGTPLQTFCEDQNLTPAQRLKQLIRLCRIIGHCHRRRVIHGDIKSNNVLIDSDGEVRLLDFGIAQLLDTAEDNDDTRGAGEPQATAMTLSVCSPEQAKGLPVTTESDVYQLGLMIYSLLSGTPPHRVKVRSAPDSWAEQITTLTLPSVDDHVGEITRRRDARFGDLNDVARKATAKDPSERYGSADQLADDLHNYLHDRPISIRRGEYLYTLKKLIGRNQLASLLAFVLSVALITTSIAYIQQIKSSQAAAEQSAAKAARTLNFISGLFDISSPTNLQGRPLTAKHLLDQGADKLLAMRETDPRGYADLSLVLAGRYLKLAEYGAAHELAEEALTMIRAAEELSDLLVTALDRRATALSRLDKHAEAVPLALEALDLFTANPSRYPDTLGYELHYTLSDAFYFLGRYPDAERHALDALASLDQNSTSDLAPGIRIRIRQLLGNIYRNLGKPKVALDQTQRAHESVRALYGEDHPEFVRSMGNLSLVHWALGNYDQALSYSEAVLEINERVYGPINKHTNIALGNLALSYIETGRFDEAITLLNRQESLIEQLELGPRSVGNNLHNRGFAHQSAGNYQQAKQTYQQALVQIIRARGEDSIWAANMLGNLGEVSVELGEFDEAQNYFQQSLNIKRKQLDEDSASMAWPHYGLGLLDLNRERYPSAREQLRIALKILTKNLGEDHAEIAFPLTALGRVALAEGDAEQAETYLRQALVLRAHLPPMASALQKTRSSLVEALSLQGKEDEVRQLSDQWQGIEAGQSKVP